MTIMNSYFHGKYFGTNRMRDTVHQQQEAALRQAAPSQREPPDSSRCSENQFSVCFLKIPSLRGGEGADEVVGKEHEQRQKAGCYYSQVRGIDSTPPFEASVYAFVRRRDRNDSRGELRPESSSRESVVKHCGA